MQTSTNLLGGKWVCSEDFDLSSDSLNALFENEIPSIRIKNFATAEECGLLARKAASHGFSYYENVSPRIGRIGITQFEHKQQKDVYFDKAVAANQVLEELTSASFHPLQRLRELIRHRTSYLLANAEDANGPYFAGLIRQIRKALLHADYGPFDGPTWGIGRIDAQIAWNLYLTPVRDGGACVVYNRLWQRSDDAFKRPGSYGYDECLVQACEKKRLTPAVGDLVLHNTRNYHEVEECVGDRLTISSFIGRHSGSRQLIAWS